MYIPPEKNDEHRTRSTAVHLAPILKEDSPNLGLLMLDRDGPERLSLERSAIALGIQKQVLFEVYSPNACDHT
jgi:hypothetical protein